MNSVRLLLRSLIARYHAADDDDNEPGHPTALFESPSSAPPPLQTVLSTDDELAMRARSPTAEHGDLHALMADEDARRASFFQREGRGAKAARRGSRSPPGAHVGFQPRSGTRSASSAAPPAVRAAAAAPSAALRRRPAAARALSTASRPSAPRPPSPAASRAQAAGSAGRKRCCPRRSRWPTARSTTASTRSACGRPTSSSATSTPSPRRGRTRARRAILARNSQFGAQFFAAQFGARFGANSERRPRVPAQVRARQRALPPLRRLRRLEGDIARGARADGGRAAPPRPGATMPSNPRQP